MLKKKFLTVIIVIGLVAFCITSYASGADRITNSHLKQYTTAKAREGSLAVPVTSRILYREALKLSRSGKWKEAREKLMLAASIDDEYAQPLFSLSRIELFHGNSEFLPHLISGIVRSLKTFGNQVLVIANTYIMLTAGLIGALFVLTLALMLKYHRFFTHTLRENYKKKYSFPNDRWFMIILLVSLAAMRLGLALYIVIFTVLTFQFLSKREKSVLIVLSILLMAISIYSPHLKPVGVALDPGSATHAFWKINRGEDSEALIKKLRELENPELEVEREFALGTLLARTGHFGEGQEHLLRAIEKRKDFAAAYINLGNVYYTAGDYDRALVGYMNALEADSTNAIAYYNLGQTYIKKLLFAKSSSSLKRANELGIEELKSRYKVITGTDPDIFSSSFNTSQLWRSAVIEAKDKNATFLDDLFSPLLLVRLRYLWIFILGGFIIAVTLSRYTRRRFNVTSCDNCGNDTCDMCSNTEFEITLCHDCAGLIEGLSSVKVMEALLRHRRQKVSKKRERKEKWKMFIFPGVAHVFHGRPESGVFTAFVSSISIAWLAWGGGFFKDTFVTGDGLSIWKILPPALVLIFAWLSSARSKPIVEPRNYRILPAELHKADRETREEEEKKQEEVEQEEKPVMLF